MLALIGEINDAFAEFAPDHIREPKKAMFRIYRDTGSLLRGQEALQDPRGGVVGAAGMEKTSGAGFYFHFSPKETVIAAGMYMPSPSSCSRSAATWPTTMRSFVRCLPDAN